MGLGCACSICPAFATIILHKNDKQLACNRHYWKQKQKQSNKDSQKKKNQQSGSPAIYHKCRPKKSILIPQRTNWLLLIARYETIQFI